METLNEENQILATVYPTERLGLGPKISNMPSISSKRNHCYRPVQSFSRIVDSNFQNSYFDKTDGQYVDSSMSFNNRVPINFNLTQQPKAESEDEDEQTMLDMMGNNTS